MRANGPVSLFVLIDVERRNCLPSHHMCASLLSRHFQRVNLPHHSRDRFIMEIMVHLRRRRHRSGSDAADKQASARNTMVDGCFEEM